MNEKQVAEILSRSSIFMSFGDIEGLSLPPLEAAFSGNIVVGYTGQGAHEYFRKPVFREVHNGNFINFCKSVVRATLDVQDGCLDTNEFNIEVEKVKSIYSKDNELKTMKAVISKIENILLKISD